MAIKKQIILIKITKLMFVLQLLCILNGTKIHTNNTLLMPKFSSISVLQLNTGSDTVTALSQSCFGGKMSSTFMHKSIGKENSSFLFRQHIFYLVNRCLILLSHSICFLIKIFCHNFFMFWNLHGLQLFAFLKVANIQTDNSSQTVHFISILF